jgi:hypothetical protein
MRISGKIFPSVFLTPPLSFPLSNLYSSSIAVHSSPSIASFSLIIWTVLTTLLGLFSPPSAVFPKKRGEFSKNVGDFLK